jgi:large subunit ribosomal protein L18
MRRSKDEARRKRHRRVRRKVFGTPEKPRLCVHRSLNHIYAQLVDDTTHRTILTVSTLHGDVQKKCKNSMKKSEQSKVAGLILAQKAKKLGIEKTVFDRAGYKYHGRVKSLADGAREGGLTF